MTASTHHGTLNTAAYSPQQAFARDVLTAAVNGGIQHWARVHGSQWDVPPGQVHAKGVDDRDGRSLWRVDLDDIQRALDTSPTTPTCAGRPSRPATGPGATNCPPCSAPSAPS